MQSDKNPYLKLTFCTFVQTGDFLIFFTFFQEIYASRKEYEIKIPQITASNVPAATCPVRPGTL